MLLTSLPDVRTSYREVLYGDLYKLLDRKGYIPITTITPAHNEEKRILNAIYSILKSNYKNVEIIIVNDGSTDNTLDLLIKEFSLYEIPPIIHQIIKTAHVKNFYKSAKYKNISVINKEPSPLGSGADAINCGINAMTTPVFLTIDADTVLEPEALSSILFRYLSKRHCIAVGGVVYPLNDNIVKDGELLTAKISKRFIPSFQALEYLRSFTYGRSGLNSFAGALCNPGAFTLNETYVVKEVNGYDAENFAYDTEMTMKLHYLTRSMKYPTKIYFMSSAIAWTEVPNTLKKFWNQRDKWQRGMIKSALKYKRMFLNPWCGFTGLVVFPAFVIFDLLSPVIEFLAYILLVLALILQMAPLSSILLLAFFAWGYIVIMTIASFYLNLTTGNKFGSVPILYIIWLITFEMFGFRQFRAAACFYGTFHYFFNRLRGKSL